MSLAVFALALLAATPDSAPQTNSQPEIASGPAAAVNALATSTAPSEGANGATASAPAPAAPSAPSLEKKADVQRAPPEGARHFGALVTLGAPRAIGIGAVASITPLFSVEANYQMLPEVALPLGEAPVGLSSNLAAVKAKLHPFSGAFYLSLGAGLGTVQLAAKSKDSGDSTMATLHAPTLTAGIGWLWRRPSGFTIGLEPLSAAYPLGGELKLSTRAADGTTSNADPNDPKTADTIAQMKPMLTVLGVPQVNLLRVGMMF